MNIKSTTSVRLPLGGEINKLEVVVNPFNLFPSHITVTWKVSGPTASKEGIITLPKYIIDQWGTDDSVVKEFVLQELGLLEEIIKDDILVKEDPVVLVDEQQSSVDTTSDTSSVDVVSVEVSSVETSSSTEETPSVETPTNDEPSVIDSTSTDSTISDSTSTDSSTTIEPTEEI